MIFDHGLRSRFYSIEPLALNPISHTTIMSAVSTPREIQATDRLHYFRLIAAYQMQALELEERLNIVTRWRTTRKTTGGTPGFRRYEGQGVKMPTDVSLYKLPREFWLV